MTGARPVKDHPYPTGAPSCPYCPAASGEHFWFAVPGRDVIQVVPYSEVG